MGIKWLKKFSLHGLKDEQIFRQTMDLCNAVSWREEGSDYALLSRLELSVEDREKLNSIMISDQECSSILQFEGILDGGSKHWYELRMHTKKTHKGKVVRYGVLVNIDDIKHLEAQELEVIRIKTNSQTREGFLSAIRHEVRTPLNAIVGFSQVLSAPGYQLTDEELAFYAKEIESNTSVLQKMINDILLATLMQNTNIAADMKPQVINQLMSLECWPESKAMVRLRENNVIFEAPYEDISVNVDAKMLITIMENFLLNASKFSDEGSTIIVGYGLSNGYLEIYVKDEGMGIPKDKQSRIFDRFFKIDSFQPGSGLGLFISKTYAELMGGTISFESEQGKGSTFRLKLNCQTILGKEASL